MYWWHNLSEALGIKYDGPNIEDSDAYLFDNYIPYGGGGKGNKNGHYGCKHSEEAKKIMSEKKKGKPTWNKGVVGYKVHTHESKRKMSEKLSGSNNGRSILTEDLVRKIIETYVTKPNIDGVGNIQRNGVPMSYDWAFCIKVSREHNVTAAAIKNLIKKKTWKNVWKEYDISDKN